MTKAQARVAAQKDFDRAICIATELRDNATRKAWANFFARIDTAKKVYTEVIESLY